MFGVEAIGNYDIRPIGNGKYSIACNNGNFGACVVDEEGLKEFREKYEGKGDRFELTAHKNKPQVMHGGNAGEIVKTSTGEIIRIPAYIGSTTRVDITKDGEYKVTTRGSYYGAKPKTTIMTEEEFVAKYGKKRVDNNNDERKGQVNRPVMNPVATLFPFGLINVLNTLNPEILETLTAGGLVNVLNRTQE